ncbi:MAG TPA: helical backbone metal receptor, partial [Thermoanaerobaculia bacterium]
LGVLHQRQSRAKVLAGELREEIAGAPQEAFTFACPIWKKPWMWCGGDTYVSSLVSACGGRNVLGERERYPALTIEEVAALRPDVIFLPDKPYLFTGEDAREIGFARVIGPFPGHLFTWHGTRTTLGLRFLKNQRPAFAGA